VTERVDGSFPDNTELTIDEMGTPHLKRLKAQPIPEDLETLEALLKERMPERHLLDILKHVHDWVGYTRHFGPPSGSDAKLADPLSRYLLTVFGVPRSSTPLGRLALAISGQADTAFRQMYTVGPTTLALSRLHDAAHMRAVYASRRGSPRYRARLASSLLAQH
jgi:hypothetical protein